jgi:hypothetical protein
MYKPKTMLVSYLGVIALIIFITSSTLNVPAIAQPNMTGSSNGTSFSPMGLANNIFNSSSLFGTLGMSMVDGVKVTGVNVLPNNDVSVTLRHTTTNTGNTTLPGSVTVTATRVPMNIRDLISIVSAASNQTANGGNNNMNMMMNPMQGYGNPTSSISNPLAFLKNIQIGSSNIVNANWRLPQSVTMGLVGLFGSSNKLTSSPTSPQTADFIIVSVIPYTGKSNPVG